MQPALRGRLSNEIELYPLRNVNEAIALYTFYLDQAKLKAREEAELKRWRVGANELLTPETATTIFNDLHRKRTTDGVRQRDYLQQLHEKANDKIKLLIS